jgi:uncharacterized protein
VPSSEVIALIGGACAGLLGAMVGIGGGVFLVPLLNSLLGLSFAEARGVSLIGVLGTSSSAAMAPTNRRVVNPRLAIFLLLFSVSGATLGARNLTLFSESTYQVLFGLSAAAVALLMLARRNIRNVLPATTADLGPFGGRMHDDDMSCEVAYRLKRAPVAAGISFVAGGLSSLIGVGGGIIIVPALNGLCGVPMRVAAATSVMMVGVTSIPGAVASWQQGFLGDLHIAGLTCLGTLAGFQVGLRLCPYVPVKWLKVGMAALLIAVAVQYLFFR